MTAFLCAVLLLGLLKMYRALSYNRPDRTEQNLLPSFVFWLWFSIWAGYLLKTGGAA